MKTHRLETRIFVSFLLLTLFLGGTGALLGYSFLQNQVIDRAQQKLLKDIETAEAVLQTEMKNICRGFKILEGETDLNMMRQRLDLDYLVFIKSSESFGPLVKQVQNTGKCSTGIRVLDYATLLALNPEKAATSIIPLKKTEYARKTNLKELTDQLVIEAAIDFGPDSHGNPVILCGGRVLNRDSSIVDRIRSFLLEDKIIDGHAAGTVTLFMNDVRVSTNVLDDNGERALGTQVSEVVNHRVLELGLPYLDRAFVVNAWYLTAYRPLKDVTGKIIGIIYVGILEKPFRKLTQRLLIEQGVIVVVSLFIALFLSLALTRNIVSPVKRLSSSASLIADGNLDSRTKISTSVLELKEVSEAFNDMALKVEERDHILSETNTQLKELNRSYIDLIGFVSHELKGILASTILNACTIRDGYLGLVNFKQRRTLDAITRSLDYLDATVKNFLNLSRLEKGQMKVRLAPFNFSKSVVAHSVDALDSLVKSKEMKVDNLVDGNLQVMGDMDLLLVVVNNLISNAVKYGMANSSIVVTSKNQNEKVAIEVFNVGNPLSDEDREKVFGKFMRLDNEEHRLIKGTGLGLFVTKEIIENHGGTIHVESRKDGNAFIFTLERKDQDVNTAQ
jgi:two-component system NtrC family sensor kinase